MNRAARIILVLIALAAALAVGGCGGDDDGESVDPQEALDQAFSPEGIGEIESGVLGATVKVGVEGEQSGSVDISVEGPFNQDGETDLTLSLTGSGGGQDLDFEGELVTTADNLYVGFDDKVYELGTERFQRLKDANTAADTDTSGDFSAGCRSSIQAAGGDPSVCEEIEPSSWLTGLEDEGTEDIGGAETNHISARIDTRTFLSDIFDLAGAVVPAGQTGGFDLEGFGDSAADFINEAAIDVYVGTEDDIPRGADLTLEAAIFGQTINADIGFELSEVNEEQTIEAPADAEPIQGLRERIPSELQPLLDCVLEAETAQEIQACAQTAVPTLPVGATDASGA